VQQRSQGRADTHIEECRRGVGLRRWWLEEGEDALVKGMHSITHRLIGAAELGRKRHV